MTTEYFRSDPYTWIEATARQAPERAFLATPSGRRWSYAEVHRLSGSWASALQRLGVNTGDRVAAQSDKSPEAVLLYLACLRMGAVYVPINPANTASEVSYFLQDSAPRVAIVRPGDAATLGPIAAAAGVSQTATLGADGTGTLADLANDAASDPGVRAQLDPSALAAIIYTSGTTGRAKGAMLTRGNLASNACALATTWKFSVNDVLLHALPLFHVHGLFAAVNTVLASGATLLLLDAFDASLVLRHLPEITVLMGVPTFYTRLLQLPGLDRHSTAHVRLFVSGSAPLLAQVHREFEERTGHVILERYGMTETLMNTSNPYEGARLPGFVGTPLPGVEIRLLDPKTGALIDQPDQTGAIEIRGPNVCAGYWRDRQKTISEMRPDGWFKSGDIGRFNREGYLQIVGRAKDMLITGGYNVYPKELEQEIDSLAGVLESAVIGLPHGDLGEAVTAIVVANPDAMISEAGIIAALQIRLARYKVPRRVLVVSELPRNTMGKVQKNLLRERHAALYET